MLEFRRSAFLDAIDEMHQHRKRIQYILELVETAAAMAAPQTQSDLQPVLRRLQNLETSYQKRIDGSEIIVEEYDKTESCVFELLDEAGRSLQSIFW